MDIPIGQAIKKVREHRNISQLQLAERIHIPRTNVSRVENNRRGVTLDTLDRYAHGLRIEPWKLIRFAEKLRKQMEAA